MAATSLWILGALGGFYALLAAPMIYRACKPSCRTCVYWQHCLSKRLGFEKPGKKCDLAAK